MNESYAKVAGLNICFSGFDLNEEAFSCWDGFLSAETPTVDILFNNNVDEKASQLPDDAYQLCPLAFSLGGDKTTVGFRDILPYEYADIKMTANKNWSRLDITGFHPETVKDEIRLLTDAAFRSRLTFFSGFVVHASVVLFSGEAVIFSARSGVGKSTHAEMWREHLSAEILNGDHALVRVIDGRVYVFGGPWSGTSPYKVNSFAPLKAIVMLEQAKNNEIFPLSGQNAFMELMSQCHLPSWDNTLMMSALTNIEEASSKTQIYKLRCNINPEAAILVRDTIFQ